MRGRTLGIWRLLVTLIVSPPSPKKSSSSSSRNRSSIRFADAGLGFKSGRGLRLNFGAGCKVFTGLACVDPALTCLNASGNLDASGLLIVNPPSPGSSRSPSSQSSCMIFLIFLPPSRFIVPPVSAEAGTFCGIGIPALTAEATASIVDFSSSPGRWIYFSSSP